RETQANHLKTSLQKITLFFSLLFANKIVFLTEQFARQVQTMLPWVFKTSKISVIPNGIDLELYQPAPPPNNNCVFIGMQSRLIKIKDHLTLLKAFSMLKNRGDQFNDLKLVIVGDGDFKSILINKAIALDIDKDVNFAGMLREPELIDFLHSLDLYIHASLGETMSTAIMQAMACKLPVIASDVDGINNMITNNTTGLLVPVTDAKALCDAMYLCITQAEVRTKIANSSYEFALNNFSNTAMFQKYKSVFN
ncbi:MAG: glycosyltransferase family 4 protein, partial [Mucilaginibacter sp.]